MPTSSESAGNRSRFDSFDALLLFAIVSAIAGIYTAVQVLGEFGDRGAETYETMSVLATSAGPYMMIAAILFAGAAIVAALDRRS